MSQETMQQVIITEPGGVDKLAYETVTIPEAKADEVLVKVHAFGINRPDILQRQGLYPMPPGVTQVPGLEVAGEVVAIGAEVTQFKLGDKVCSLTNGGGYAEYCVVPQSQTLHIPENVSFVEAAAIPETFFTVWANVFQMGKAKAGEVVLVHGGTSGIGTTALMLCKALGIKTFATVGSDEKVQAIANLTDAINYKTQDFEHLINEKTDNAGVDVILDMVGAPYLEKNLNLLRRDGRLVYIAFLGGAKAKEVKLGQIMMKRLTITGSTMRARNTAEKAEIAQGLQDHVAPLWAKGECLPMIYQTFEFDQIQAAHACMDTGEHVGKVVVKIL
ncbi:MULTISPECIES: NAD(P)H-quinone oxidoreductase [Acinetobacter]|uniref:NAD(P)H-quinone oxidoreductase n=1 Tax=Acinetobacter TaxID=469 RepID=UPI001917D6E2|nr:MULTISPECIES: NAD(P)H-quinone oxidoreductase [Acinetobacter]MBC6675882.1 NAD(P)H-quinone oxidoreductase [Acinetobacter sp.]MCU4325508.1 NAD(P)H-quinone oxidoreductase [Acinetobacter johnsonii]MDH2047742.1 NAD(P)H-quinone oxidoreductase [Acinetobacter johnsonii]QQT56921.1 NAD(P)H-quinone oxidoreductase [Acinetobacter johnsonii]QQV08493.1 NAD(P)H-quinone oxidoreductase [Acinetobacter johnsonii]